MSLEFITGTMGASKTFHAVSTRIIPVLREGRPVVTNITGLNLPIMCGYFGLNLGKCQRLLYRLNDQECFSYWKLSKYHSDYYHMEEPTEFDEESLHIFYKEQQEKNSLLPAVMAPKNALIIIDEAQKYYSKYDYNKQSTKDMFIHVTHSRKYGHEIIFITQAVQNIDSSIRTLCELNHYLRSAHVYGMGKNSYYHNIYDKDFFEGEIGRLNRVKIARDVRIFEVYQSYNPTDAEGVIDHKKGSSVFGQPKFIISVVLFVVCIVVFVPSFFKYKRVADPTKINAVKNVTTQNKPVADTSSSGGLTVFLDGVRYE